MTKLDKNQISEIIARIRDGEKSAPAELLGLIKDPIYRFCLYLTSTPEAASDLCQETLVDALLQLKNLEDPHAFVSWIHTIAKHRFLNNKRKYKREDLLDDEPLKKAADDHSLNQTPDTDKSLWVRQCLSQLDEDDRLIVILVDIEEHSYAEVAKIIGISESAARSRLHRARGALKIILEAETNSPPRGPYKRGTVSEGDS